MVGSIRPSLWGLTCVLAFSTIQAVADDPPAEPPKDPAARAAYFALPGEDPVPPFVPERPRTVEDRKRIEALSDYSAARAFEDQHALTDAIARLDEALKLEPDSVAILRRLSRLSFVLGKAEQALKYSKQTLDADPDDPDTIVRLVNFYTSTKSEPAAAESFLKGLLANPKLDPHASGALIAEFELGKLYAGKLQDPEKAADAFARVVSGLDDRAANRLSPKDLQRIVGSDPEEAYLEFGETFLLAKRYDLAIHAFRRGLVYKSDDTQLTLLLAQALLKQDKAADALAVVEDYLKRQPQGGEAYELLARALTALHREKEITPRLEAAAQADSKNVSLQYALADRYRETGRTEKADALYKKLLAQGPSPKGFGALAASLLKRKQTDELLKVLTQAIAQPEGALAVKDTLKAITDDPVYADQVLDAGVKLLSSDPPALDKTTGVQVLSYVATQANKLEKLLPVQRLALKWNPSPTTYRELIFVLKQLRKFDEAADGIDQLIEKFPDEKNARLFVELSMLRRLGDKKDAAVKAARAALKVDPTDGDAQSQLVLALAQTGKFDEAVAVTREALKTDPANPEFNQLLGYVLTQYNKNDEAIALYKGLLERYPNNEAVVKTARSGLSVVYINMGEFAKAEAELETLLQKSPEDPGVNNDLGYLYADQGKNLEKAETMIRQALQEKPEDAAYLDSLGWVLYKQGKLKDAVDALEKAVKGQISTDATIYEHLGDVFFSMQQNAKAKTAWEEAEKQGSKATPPDRRLPEIRKKLKALEQLGASPKPSAGATP